MPVIRKAATLALPATALALMLGTVPAHATTDACQAALGTQCGTFAAHDAETIPHDVFWDVKGRTAAPDVPVIGYGVNSAQDPATDFTKVEHRGTVPGLGQSNASTVSYSFVYTPDGRWTSLCAADTGSHVLTLRTCNGMQWQRFIAQRAMAGSTPAAFDGSAFNGDRIFNGGNAEPFALLGVAYRLYVKDTSSASSLSPPPSGPDTRTLKLDTVETTFGSMSVWAWTS